MTRVMEVAVSFSSRPLRDPPCLRRTVAVAGALTLTGGTLVGVLPLLGVRNVWAVVLPFYLFMIAHGVHQPCGQSGAVGPFPQAAGAASALSGFLITVVAFAMGGWLGQHLQTGAGGSVLPLTYGIWFWATTIALTAWTLVWRFGEPRSAPLRMAGASTP